MTIFVHYWSVFDLGQKRSSGNVGGGFGSSIGNGSSSSSTSKTTMLDSLIGTTKSSSLPMGKKHIRYNNNNTGSSTSNSTTLLSDKKIDELLCSIDQYDFVYGSFVTIIYTEIEYWVRRNIMEYSNSYHNNTNQTQSSLVLLPRNIVSSYNRILSSLLSSSWDEWELYLNSMKERLFPILLEYQATIITMTLFRNILTKIFVSSNDTTAAAATTTMTTMLCRFTQHPYHRSLAIASHNDTDNLTLGMEMWAVTLWSNIIYYSARYTVRQLHLLYLYYRRTQNRRRNFSSIFFNNNSTSSNTSTMYYHRHQRQRLGGGNIGGTSAATTTYYDNNHNHSYNNNNNDDDDDQLVQFRIQFQTSSWNLFYSTCRSYYYTSLGSGIGSMFYPGWGTMIGIGLGDILTSNLPIPEFSTIFLNHNNNNVAGNDINSTSSWWMSLLRNIVPLSFVDVIGNRHHSNSSSSSSPSSSFDSDQQRKQGGNKKRSNAGGTSPSKNVSTKISSSSASFLLNNTDALVCGCCQIVTFSSNPTPNSSSSNSSSSSSADKRTPISSRACDHTICQSCVEKCHIALMERTFQYEEWIKCPLCNAQRAFWSHNHIVNRSLCGVIAAIEQQQQEEEQQQRREGEGEGEEEE